MIKSLAAQILQRADQDAVLVPTGNFNHSYLPDFVLEWRGGTRLDRHVYLRTSPFSEEIAEDVRTLSDRRPILLQLADLIVPEEGSTEDHSAAVVENVLSETAKSSRSLVTSLPALEQFTAPKFVQTGGILSSYVLRGGQGLVAGDAAEESAARVERGFSGAIELDRDSTSEALDVVDSLLDAPSATQFTHLLEAAWVSGGGAPLEFPGPVDSLGGKLSPQLLRELFRIVPADHADFWRNIGRAVDVHSFEGLERSGADEQLQLLMTTALPGMRAKKCLIRRNELAVPKDDPFLWQIDSGSIALRGGGFKSWFSGASGLATASDFSIQGPPSITRIESRAANAELPLIGVDVADDVRAVSFASSSRVGVAGDALLGEIADTMGSGGLVRKAVTVVGDRDLNLHFATGTASLNTRAELPLEDIGWATWNLLVDLGSDEDRSRLSDVLGRDTQGELLVAESIGQTELSGREGAGADPEQSATDIPIPRTVEDDQ